MNAYGMTAIARLLGVSPSTVKNLWNGRTDKNGHSVPPQLVFRVTPTGRRYSTKADINKYLQVTYKTQLQ